jgi:hypothetical protein
VVYLSGAVKQLEMTSLLCAQCLPANRAFWNRKSGWSTLSRSFQLLTFDESGLLEPEIGLEQLSRSFQLLTF